MWMLSSVVVPPLNSVTVYESVPPGFTVAGDAGNTLLSKTGWSAVVIEHSCAAAALLPKSTSLEVVVPVTDALKQPLAVTLPLTTIVTGVQPSRSPTGQS